MLTDVVFDQKLSALDAIIKGCNSTEKGKRVSARREYIKASMAEGPKFRRSPTKASEEAPQVFR